MAEKLLISEKPKRIYSIEFLRIFFVFFIILGHCMQSYPEIKYFVHDLLGSNLVSTWFCVEYYSIIGGFLIYYNKKEETRLFDRLKHVYLRLSPAVLFLYFLGLVFGLTTISNLLVVLTMTQGLSIPIADAIGWGDWFAGAYFWASCVFISLLFYFKDKAFMLILPLIYVCIVTQTNMTYPGWMKSYGGIVGTEFLRVLYCMGCGIVAAFLAKNLHFTKQKIPVLFASVLECICLYLCFKKIIYGNSLFGIISVLGCCIFLVLAANSAGYVSKFINKIKKINYLSKYAWSIFIGHAFVLTFLLDKSFDISQVMSCFIVFFGAIILGVFEYHVIEKKLVPWLLNYFSKDISTK